MVEVLPGCVTPTRHSLLPETPRQKPDRVETDHDSTAAASLGLASPCIRLQPPHPRCHPGNRRPHPPTPRRSTRPVERLKTPCATVWTFRTPGRSTGRLLRRPRAVLREGWQDSAATSKAGTLGTRSPPHRTAPHHTTPHPLPQQSGRCDAGDHAESTPCPIALKIRARAQGRRVISTGQLPIAETSSQDRPPPCLPQAALSCPRRIPAFGDTREMPPH